MIDFDYTTRGGMIVHVTGTVDHDPGCWRTSNGDGWPESWEVNWEAEFVGWSEWVDVDTAMLPTIDELNAELEADGQLIGNELVRIYCDRVEDDY